MARPLHVVCFAMFNLNTVGLNPKKIVQFMAAVSLFAAKAKIYVVFFVFFLNFFERSGPEKGVQKIFQKNVDLGFCGNRATTRAHYIYCAIFLFLAHCAKHDYYK